MFAKEKKIFQDQSLDIQSITNLLKDYQYKGTWNSEIDNNVN